MCTVFVWLLPIGALVFIFLACLDLVTIPELIEEPVRIHFLVLMSLMTIERFYNSFLLIKTRHVATIDVIRVFVLIESEKLKLVGVVQLFLTLVEHKQ